MRLQTIFGLAALALGVSATPTPKSDVAERDPTFFGGGFNWGFGGHASVAASSCAEIGSAFDSFHGHIEGFVGVGGGISVGTIESDCSSIHSLIIDATAKIEGSASLSISEALALQVAVKTLEAKVQLVSAALIAKQSIFVEAGLAQTIYVALQAQASACVSLGNACQGILPFSFLNIAGIFTASITGELNKCVSSYGGYIGGGGNNGGSYTPYKPTYATPTYGAPTYSKPTYGFPTYSKPTYGVPTYSTPTYGVPTYSTPTYGAPTTYKPSPTAPTYTAPGGGSYTPSTPSYPSYTPPTYSSKPKGGHPHKPTKGHGGHGGNGGNGGSYTPPSYSTPSYSTPVYTKPSSYASPTPYQIGAVDNGATYGGAAGTGSYTPTTSATTSPIPTNGAASFGVSGVVGAVALVVAAAGI